MQTFAREYKTPGLTSRKISTPVYRSGGDSQQDAIRRILRPVVAQPKLTIGASDDVCEQEADRVADEVMRMPEPRLQTDLTCNTVACPQVGEETIQPKPLPDQIPSMVQGRNEEDEAEELLQTKSTIGRTLAVTPTVAAEIAAMQGRGRSLTEAERTFFG